jgi:hypothetical protein
MSLVTAPLALPVLLACELVGSTFCLSRDVTACHYNLSAYLVWDKGLVSDYLGKTMENNVHRGMYTKIKIAR